VVQVARTIGKVLVYLATMIFELFKPIIKVVVKLLEKLAELYTQYLKPILDAIEKIRRRVLQIYERILRPVLLVMQRLHQILTILRLFHLKFAAKLDAELQNLEAKLFKPMYQLLHYINELANMLNLVFDAGLVLRRAVTLNALDRTKGSWTRMWYNAQTRPIDSDTLRTMVAKNAVPDEDASLSNFRQYISSASGPLQTPTDEGIALFQRLVGV